jgi:hypothetical protein
MSARHAPAALLLAVLVLLLCAPSSPAEERDDVLAAFWKQDWKVGDTGKFPIVPEIRKQAYKHRELWTIVQVRGKDAVIARFHLLNSDGSGEPLYYFEGFPTEGLVDGKYHEFTGRFVIAGTKTLPLKQGGTRTLYLVKPDPKKDK